MDKVYKALFGIFCVVCAAVLTLYGITRETADEIEHYETDNPYIVRQGKTLVSAHRSGAGIFPENTLMAFKGCMESDSFHTDIYEFDLHITKDGQLILLHDGTLDRTTNAAEQFGRTDNKPSAYTLAEIRQLNFGENFTAEDGTKPYKGLRGADIPADLRAVTLDEVLAYLESRGHFGYIIEIKDGQERGYRAADELYRILTERGLLQQAVIGTFNGEVTKYIDEKYPDMLRSAGIREVLEIYFCAMLGINRGDGAYKFDALQIPADQFVINLCNTRFMNYAHRHNIALQYWTINDEQTVEKLAARGADCVMSDYPDMAYNVINGVVAVGATPADFDASTGMRAD